MRKVIINRLVNSMEYNTMFNADCKAGSPWELVEGLFHQWGTVTTDGGVNTVALVELEDGTIVEVLPANIFFLVETKEKELKND